MTCLTNSNIYRREFISDLDSGLGQVDLERHLLPHEDVGVAGLPEQSLQDVELRAGEGRPLSPLLPRGRCSERHGEPLSTHGIIRLVTQAR